MCFSKSKDEAISRERGNFIFVYGAASVSVKPQASYTAAPANCLIGDALQSPWAIIFLYLRCVPVSLY